MPAKDKVVKVKKPCNCVEQVNEQIKPMNARLALNMQMDFKRGKASMSPPRVILEKIDSQNRKPLLDLYVAFCPFCGKKVPQ